MREFKSVAIQGGVGSFHHIAISNWLATANLEAKIIFCQSFEQVLEALHEGIADVALMAIHNSTIGLISESHSVIDREKKLTKGPEIVLNIHHQLIGHSDAKIENIRYIHSQIMAIEQCKNFISKNLPGARIMIEDDTALSVQKIIDNHDDSHAAIASELAAKEYGGSVIRQDIEDKKDNRTTFGFFYF